MPSLPSPHVHPLTCNQTAIMLGAVPPVLLLLLLSSSAVAVDNGIVKDAADMLTDDIVHIGFYVGGGTSKLPATTGETTSLGSFYSTLQIAAGQAFGGPASFTITNLTEDAVRALTPAQYAVVVFPGGSGKGQAKAIGEAGLVAVRRCVAREAISGYSDYRQLPAPTRKPPPRSPLQGSHVCFL